MANLSAYESLVFLLRRVPEDNVGTHPGREVRQDWDGIMQEAIRHQVAPLLYAHLKTKAALLDVPVDVMDRLNQAYLYHGFKNTQLLHELSNVLTELRKAGLSNIVLKGAHLAETVYGNPALRPMDDVDLLVKRADLASVENKLRELGYVHPEHFKEHTKLDSHHLPAFAKPGGKAVIEVHWAIPPSQLLRIDLEGLWQRSQPATIAGVETRTLSSEDLLLHLCVHASVHHRFGVGLRALADIREVIQHHGNRLNWKELVVRACQWHARRGAHLALYISKDLLGTDVPQRALDDLMPTDFDEGIVRWAKEQVAKQNTDLINPSSPSPRMATILENKSILQKTSSIIKAVFPPLDEVALTYHVPLRSRRVLLYYPVRLKDLLQSRGRAAWRVLRRDKHTTAQADMYRRLVDDVD